jgi:hypothetical protein
MRRVRWWLLLVPAVMSGCSGQIPGPKIDAAAATERAFEEYDLNKDGFLDARELERCPGLKSCLAHFDKNRDGRLSRDELEAGLAAYKESQAGLLAVICHVTLDGQPLKDATVVLEPESFLDSIEPA